MCSRFSDWPFSMHIWVYIYFNLVLADPYSDEKVSDEKALGMLLNVCLIQSHSNFGPPKIIQFLVSLKLFWGKIFCQVFMSDLFPVSIGTKSLHSDLHNNFYYQ